jgi:hypothetical protein
MKKLLALILIALMLTACGNTQSAETTVPTTLPPVTTAPLSYAVPGEADMPANASQVDWGLTLTANKVQKTGCMLHYVQSGGNPTGQLQTGTFFSLEVYDGQWTPTQYRYPDSEINWNAIAYMIPMEGHTDYPEDWSFLHGELTPGWYRIGKEITDFRGPGDYDTAIYYAYFEITE